MRAFLTLFVLSVLAILSCPPALQAQDEGMAGLSVRVFNRKTLRPLKHVNVLYAEFEQRGLRRVVQFGIVLDSDYYQLEVETGEPVFRYLHAICETPMGPFTGGAHLFNHLRSQEYRREIYIDLPEGIDDCLRP